MAKLDFFITNEFFNTVILDFFIVLKKAAKFCGKIGSL